MRKAWITAVEAALRYGHTARWIRRLGADSRIKSAQRDGKRHYSIASMDRFFVKAQREVEQAANDEAKRAPVTSAPARDPYAFLVFAAQTETIQEWYATPGEALTAYAKWRAAGVPVVVLQRREAEIVATARFTDGLIDGEKR